MKTSTVVSTIAILIIAAGAWYYLSKANMPTDQDQIPAPTTQGPSAAAGINGSPNQGNMGDAAAGTQLAGTPQVNDTPGTPMADGAEGSIIGSNLALGLDGKAGVMHLIGYNGMTLYTKDGDTATTSTCYGQCAINWPPYIVGAEDNVHNVKAGVNGKVDSIVRTDGKAQVTYNGKPLYFYPSDKSGSDTTGDGVGGVWHVAKP